MNEDDILNAAIYGELLGYIRKVDTDGCFLCDYQFYLYQRDIYLVSFDENKNVLDESRKLSYIDICYIRVVISSNEFQVSSTIKRRNRWTEQGIAKRNAEIERLRRI